MEVRPANVPRGELTSSVDSERNENKEVDYVEGLQPGKRQGQVNE